MSMQQNQTINMDQNEQPQIGSEQITDNSNQYQQQELVNSNEAQSTGQETEQIQSSNQNNGSPLNTLAAKKQISASKNGEFKAGRWSEQEHNAFLEALRMYGKNWDLIQKHVKSRCVQNIRSHSQKFNQKLERLVDANGDLREGVDNQMEKQAGVDIDNQDAENECTASFYFKLLQKKPKKEIYKNKDQMTESSQRRESHDTFNIQTGQQLILNQEIVERSASFDQQDKSRSLFQQDNERRASPNNMEMEFNPNQQNQQQQNQHIPQFDYIQQEQTNVIIHQQIQQQMNEPTRVQQMQVQDLSQQDPNSGTRFQIPNRNSFREHQLYKLHETLGCNNRSKQLTDAELNSYNDYFFDQLDQRENDPMTKPKGQSFKSNNEFIQNNLQNNGRNNLGDQLNKSRFNFQQTDQSLQDDFSKYQQKQQLEYCKLNGIEPTPDILSQLNKIQERQNLQFQMQYNNSVNQQQQQQIQDNGINGIINFQSEQVLENVQEQQNRLSLALAIQREQKRSGHIGQNNQQPAENMHDEMMDTQNTSNILQGNQAMENSEDVDMQSILI